MTLAPEQYAVLAERKLQIARRHLAELVEGMNFASVTEPPKDDGSDSRAAIDGHADGCVVQQYAAFDTLACGISQHFGLADPQRASFGRLVARLGEPEPPFVSTDVEEVVEGIQNVTDTKGWSDLAWYRNHAVHRGLTAMVSTWNEEDRFVLRIGDIGAPDPDGSEVVPILKRLLAWSGETLPPLVELIESW